MSHTYQLIRLMITLRIRGYECVSFMKMEVLKNSVCAKLLAPLMVCDEHCLCLFQVVLPRPQEAPQVEFV